MSTSELVESVLARHGGLDRWRELSTVRAHQVVSGGIWALKQQEGVLDDTYVTVDLHRQWASHEPFGKPGLRSVFTGERVAIETVEGVVLEERFDPRASFEGHQLDTPWDRLQLAYFGCYAMRTYLTTPLCFAEPGFVTEEVESVVEDGETWRGIKVTFPEEYATHSAEQIFYVDPEGLIRRHDYAAEVLNAGWAAHYSSEHRTVGGIVLPTRRRVYPKGSDGRPVLDTLLVSIDLDEISF